MYYPLAQQEFESYLNGYDRENDRIKLKIIHTICHPSGRKQ